MAYPELSILSLFLNLCFYPSGSLYSSDRDLNVSFEHANHFPSSSPLHAVIVVDWLQTKQQQQENTVILHLSV